ncbi:PrpF domain-containing protein [Dactylosporangium sp. NPDC051541]|uniref:PrpF domain-containing protein n=1 Tax=Dactylosporangium sp. NPDC051541 TaxID=3363977 RepID=UPI0037B44572
MITGIAHAIGAAGPTAVLDLATLPKHGPGLAAALAEVRARLSAAGLGNVSKIALVQPAAGPDADLELRFVQALPDGLNRFEFGGAGGHSVLAAVTVAARAGWIAPLDPIRPVRVRTLDNGGLVVCTARAAGPSLWRFDAEFVNHPPRSLDSLLTTGRPVDTVGHAGAAYQVSIVSMGRPYVFVAARALGLDHPASLFAADERVRLHLEGIRRSAAAFAGRPADGAAPKVAAVGVAEDGRLFLRASAVAGWHPTLPLTGAGCLAAAVTIPGTIPHALAARGRHSGSQAPLDVDTPGGRAAVATFMAPHRPDALQSVSIGGTEVLVLSPAARATPPLAPHT